MLINLKKVFLPVVLQALVLDLVDGGKLVLKMGPRPNESWGSHPDDAPPSMSPKVQKSLVNQNEH